MDIPILGSMNLSILRHFCLLSTQKQHLCPHRTVASYYSNKEQDTFSIYLSERDIQQRHTWDVMHASLSVVLLLLHFFTSSQPLVVVSACRVYYQPIATIQHLILVFLFSLSVCMLLSSLAIIWVLKIEDTSKYSESKECQKSC